MSKENDLPIAALLLTTGKAAPSLEQKVRLVASFRSQSEEMAGRIDHFLLEQLERQISASAGLQKGLREAEANLKNAKAVLQKLGATPWHPAIYLGPVTTSLGPRAIVLHKGSERVVGLAEGIEPEHLGKGEEVFLGSELNVIVARSPHGFPQHGDTAYFDHSLPDSRVVLTWRDEQVVVDAADSLADVSLQDGDLIRWKRDCHMAYEKLEKTEGNQFLLHEVPDVGPEQVGGHDDILETILSALASVLSHPDEAAAYGLGGRQSILMVGPPGTGKTLRARVAASVLSRMNGSKCRFGIVKPAEWESMWVGQSQANIRDCFRALKKAAKDGFAVLFLDEIEAVGRARGGAVGHHSDKFLAALLAELDGFEDRTSTAIIAATNRRDLVDPALLERLSDIQIDVPRPDYRAAQAIFEVHLPPAYRYGRNGSDPEDTRREMIETAVSRFYSPNGDNDICVIRFRDGKARTAGARELMSGRIIEQICRAARRAAFQRVVRGEEKVGMEVRDMEDAVAEALARMRSTLSPANVHGYLPDLPQDLDVVAVDPIQTRVERPYRYLSLDET